MGQIKQQKSVLQARQLQKDWGFSCVRLTDLPFKKVVVGSPYPAGVVFIIGAYNPFNTDIICITGHGGLRLIRSDGTYTVRSSGTEFVGAIIVPYIAIDPTNGDMYWKDSLGNFHWFQYSVGTTNYPYQGIVGSIPVGALVYQQSTNQSLNGYVVADEFSVKFGAKEGQIVNPTGIFQAPINGTPTTHFTGNEGLYVVADTVQNEIEITM